MPRAHSGTIPGHFNPRSLAGATVSSAHDKTAAGISIHAPSRERPQSCGRERGYKHISIHAPSRERRRRLRSPYSPQHNFNPRSLAGATGRMHLRLNLTSNFNPRSLAGATGLPSASMHNNPISIHAPSRERLQYGDTTLLPDYISIHAPSRERLFCALVGFLLTFDFNPRSLAGATYKNKKDAQHYAISIHAPSRERRIGSFGTSGSEIFQSTLPRGSDFN